MKIGVDRRRRLGHGSGAGRIGRRPARPCCGRSSRRSSRRSIRRHENPIYLAGVPLSSSHPRDVRPRGTATACDAWLVVTPAQHMRSVLERARDLRQGRSSCARRGSRSAAASCFTRSPGRPARASQIAVLSGPTFAHEVAKGLPTAVTLAAEDVARSPSSCATALAQPTFRIYVSDDVAGAEIGGAVKNVLAIACGVVEGKGLGHNARAALIGRGFAEMTRFGHAFGARRETLAGLQRPWRSGADLHLDQLAQLLAWGRARPGAIGGGAASGPPDGRRGRVYCARPGAAGARERHRHADRRRGRCADRRQRAMSTRCSTRCFPGRREPRASRNRSRCPSSPSRRNALGRAASSSPAGGVGVGDRLRLRNRRRRAEIGGASRCFGRFMTPR